MPIRVKIASTPTELDGLFRARHDVFVEEEGYFKKTPNGRIYDQFDAFPTTVNLIAIVNQEVVGGLRLTENSAAGLPTDDFFDFSPYMPEEAARAASASMLCMRREFRSVHRLTFILICMGVYWGVSKKLKHVVAAVNPAIERMLRAVGFEPAGSVFQHDAYGVDVLPVILHLEKLDDNFLEMAKFQGFNGALQTFDREFYREGEKIIECGSEGNAAYVVVDGKVTISRPGRRACDPPARVLSEMGPGELFGEVALLTSQPQSADAVAATDVDLMVIEREVFQDQLLGNPTMQRELLELLGQRLLDAVERCSEISQTS